jgi:hypothetical protein
METCHICKGALLMQEWPVHCEDCSGDCENHDEPACTPIYVLFNGVRKLLAALGSLPSPAPQHTSRFFRGDGVEEIPTMPTITFTPASNLPPEKMTAHSGSVNPAPSLPSEGTRCPIGWKRVEEELPEEDSDVLAAIWWTVTPEPALSHFEIHDCNYYEGGEGSKQKIFTDCEGEEFEAQEVDYWIYKHELGAQFFPARAEAPQAQECGQSQRDMRLIEGIENQNIIYYGPHECDLCGAKNVIRGSVKDGFGDIRFDWPVNEPYIYPNHNWIWHQCKSLPVNAARAEGDEK